MKTLLLLYLIFLNYGDGLLSGYFWHITDLHWDPSYNLTGDPESVCASSGRRPATAAGRFGDYLCDSPWDLINSTVHAMKTRLPDPDFILWTGDDTPHVPNTHLGEEAVLTMISNITSLIKQLFPNTPVYPALGNHDYHPKSQLPAGQSYMYEQTARIWSDWLDAKSQKTFEMGGYYTELLVNQPGFRIIVLNSNLYYNQNKVTENLADPAGQFSWADQVLTEAARTNEKVYIIGHVPPGVFEKKRNKSWYRPTFNKHYLDLIRKHHPVIMGQFFGHQHMDSFRMFYNLDGSPIGTMFICPGVTPWKTTLPGVVGGSNNPGIRIFEYDTKTLLVKDMEMYYLNLTYANMAQESWEKEYRLTESFRVPDASPASMHQVLGRMEKDRRYLQKYYEFNSVSYELSECDNGCCIDHLCAVREVDFDRYKKCVENAVAGAASVHVVYLQSLCVVFLLMWLIWR